MNENEILERTLTILEHTNKQVGECLWMMTEKDAEIAELEKTIKILEASGGPETIEKEDVNNG